MTSHEFSRTNASVIGHLIDTRSVIPAQIVETRTVGAFVDIHVACRRNDGQSIRAHKRIDNRPNSKGSVQVVEWIPHRVVGNWHSYRLTVPSFVSSRTETSVTADFVDARGDVVTRWRRLTFVDIITAIDSVESGKKKLQITHCRLRWNCWFRRCKCPRWEKRMDQDNWQRQRFDWWHVPPLRHGDGSTHLAMESSAFSHKDLEKLEGQMQEVPLPVGCWWHDPPLRQENSGRWQSDPRSCWHRSPIVADVSQWATTFESFVVDGRNPPGNTRD